MERRQFLSCLIGSVLAGTLPVGLVRAAAPPGATEPPRLVVIFLRGGIDGLSVVVPYHDEDYYQARPNIALPLPGKEGGVLDLDGRFGLHPALAGLMPMWRDKSLAFVHASGSPHPTRSHFEAQDYMEGGLPGSQALREGWLNRLVGLLPDQASPVKAVNADPILPRILQGRQQAVATVTLGPGVARTVAVDRPPVHDAFEKLYAGDPALSQAYREGVAAHRRLRDDFAKEMAEADRSAVPAHGFAGNALQLGRLIHADPEIRLAFLSVGGWDTHVGQGAVTGQLPKKLKALGDGLEQLAQGLGSSFGHTVVVLLSEFGRTVRENGSGGTDHGHGNVLWLMGGRINGGKVLGTWPGLDAEDQFEARDLAVTTDFRTVLAGVLRPHLGLSPVQLASVFPQFTPESGFPGVLRA